MYESFYGFHKPPFSNIPDPDFLFLSPHHKRALSILQYAVMARAGFCVITGNVGAGKTTLVRRVLQGLDQRIHVGLVSNTQCENFEELLRWILLAFELEYRGKDKVEMYDEFVQFLIRQFQSGNPVTLIIDEAQNLGIENLEQLRMLSNVNTERGQILQTILVGQPELWTLLRDPRMEQFAQRISYDYFLQPLDDVESVRQYVEHRVSMAGGSDALFEPDTFELIQRATRGVPRLINLICDTALVYGYGEGAKQITSAMVRQVIADKQSNFSPIDSASVEATNQAPDSKGGGKKGKVGPPPNTGRKLSTIERAALRKTKGA